MRTGRRERQDTRRRQEQDYRDAVIELKGLNTQTIEGRQLVPVKQVPSAIFDAPRIVLPETVPRSHIPLIILAYTLFLLTLGVNASVAWDRGTTVLDEGIMALFGMAFEALLFFLPSQASTLWAGGCWIKSTLASVLCVFLFVSGFMASLAFASLNLTDTTTARAERITPAVADAQRRLDTLTASRKDECLKRGDKCRQLERDEQTAMEALQMARERVSATADPQIASAAKLVAWVSRDTFHPSADDFAMLRLLLLTLLPQLGGLVLMVASRR